MTIDKKKDGETLRITLEGRLDIVTSSMLEKELDESLDGIRDLTFDMTKLDYISSAGLRTLMNAYHKLQPKGTLKIFHATEIVREVLSVSGMDIILTVVPD